MCIYTVQSTFPLLDNCDSTYYNIPSFIVVNGVLNSSDILITSYTIIIITRALKCIPSPQSVLTIVCLVRINVLG